MATMTMAMATLATTTLAMAMVSFPETFAVVTTTVRHWHLYFRYRNV
jgi:hypothetical protein